MSFLYIPESFNLVFHALCIVLMNLYEPAAVQFYMDPLVQSFTWEDQDRNGIVHSSQECSFWDPCAYFSYGFF